MSLYDNIMTLFDEGMYSNIVHLGALLFANDSQLVFLSDHFHMSSWHTLQCMVWLADSYMHLHSWRQAELQYRRVLLRHKHLLKQNPPGSCSGLSDLCIVHVKYRLHTCLVAMRQISQAIAVLESVPCKQRTLQTNMALGRLYAQSGVERAAVSAYKEVLRSCPFALEAAGALLRLGVKGCEVSGLALCHRHSFSPQWQQLVNSWLKMSALYRECEYTRCVTAAASVQNSPLAHSHQVALVRARSLYCMGESGQAMQALEALRAQTEVSGGCEGVDLLAELYYEQNCDGKLQSLAAAMAHSCHSMQAVEPWIALSYYALYRRKLKRALYLAHRALSIDPSHVEALTLKAVLLYNAKQYKQASIHFRQALQMAPQRYEPTKGLIECYMAMGRVKEALSLANTVCKHSAYSPRSLTLCASIMVLEGALYLSRARSYLERALQVHKHFLPAAKLLAEVYERLGDTEAAIHVLRSQAQFHSSASIHVLLSDLLVRAGRETGEVITHYQKALSLDPGNEVAARGLLRLQSDNSEPAEQSPENTEIVEDSNSDFDDLNFDDLQLVF